MALGEGRTGEEHLELPLLHAHEPAPAGRAVLLAAGRLGVPKPALAAQLLLCRPLVGARLAGQAHAAARGRVGLVKCGVFQDLPEVVGVAEAAGRRLLAGSQRTFVVRFSHDFHIFTHFHTFSHFHTIFTLFYRFF
jgi:hypothetical protein